MGVLPRAMLWTRTDVAGAEQVVFDDRRGLTAHGVQVAVDPVPYSCHYELFTDDRWATARFEVTAQGAGWFRSVRLERAAGRWRVTTAEQGELDAELSGAAQPGLRSAATREGGATEAPRTRERRRAQHGPPGMDDPDELHGALDVDLAGSPLTNTLPLRRAGFTDTTILAAWVLVPSLQVVPAEQTYTMLGPGKVRYTAGAFTADLDVDTDGYVVHYPGLARRS